MSVGTLLSLPSVPCHSDMVRRPACGEEQAPMRGCTPAQARFHTDLAGQPVNELAVTS